VLIGLVLLAIHERIAPRTPPIEIRSGSWMVLWLAGLAVLSYLSGDLDDSATIGFWTGVLLTAVFSVVIYFYAMSVRLSEERMQEHMDQVAEEAKAESEELGGAI
jgi:hypothetical protein